MSRSLHRGTWELGIVVCLGITGACVPSGNYVLAQLRPDNTLGALGALGAESSLVTPQNPLTDRIDGGAIRGANLFHSFLEFNVDEGRGVYFSNPSGIENILSRVTGGKPSQILGHLGVLGEANLFLLNPKGILFGRNASLDIKGSFLATTADAIKLGEQGYFSAAEPQNSQLLSVTPGLLFFNAVADQSAAITNRGNLATGQNLTLTAGNLNLEGQLHAGKNLTLNSGGSITLNGIVDASPILDSDTYLGNGGDVTLLANGDITLAPGSAITSFGLLGGNITLKSNAAISATGGIITSSSMTNVPGITGGDINVIASSLSFTNGAQLGATTLGNGNAGNLKIQASDSVLFDGVARDGTASGAVVASLGEGNAGEINITTRSLSVTNGAQLGAATSGKGNAGSVTIQSSDSLSFDGVGSNGNSSGAIVGSLGEGNGGNLNIITRSLSVTNGAQLGAATLGTGNAGSVTIQSSDSLSFDGVGSNGNSSGAVVASRAQGNAGDIKITTRSLSVTNGAQLGAATLGTGNAGSVTIQASDSLSFDGVGSNGNSSSVIVGSEAEGNGGDIKITTSSLSVTNGAQLVAATSGKGNAGNVMIEANDSISFDGVGSNGNSSGAIVGSLGQGDAGEINITTRSLSVINGAQLLAGTTGEGKAGSVAIQATDSVSVRNDSAVGASSEGAGEPGDVTIKTGRLNVTDRSRVSVSNLGSATGGELDITAGSILLNNQGQLTAETNSGEGGNIRLKVPDLLLMRRNSSISTEARGAGNSGNININTKFLVAIPSENSDIIASAVKGGNIEITAQGIFGIQFRESLTPESDITATGTVTLNTPEVDIQSRLNQLNANFVNPEQAIASSCLARRNKLAGSFTVTGTGGLPLNPYETLSSQYPVTTVQGIPTEARQQASSPIPNSPYPIANQWKLGDPVQEAQGIMVTADGRIIAGTAPQLVAAAKAQELVCN